MLEPVIEALASLQEDVPKSLQEKLGVTIRMLQEDGEFSIKRNRVLAELEDLSEHSSLESYERMQLLNVVSLLERL